MERVKNHVEENNRSHNRSIISREDLWDLMKQLHPDISKSSIDWFVYNCVENKIFTRIGRNMYTLYGSDLDKGYYLAERSSLLNQVSGYLEKRFPEMGYQLWETPQLSEFLDEPLSRHVIFVEAERGMEETIFRSLKNSRLCSVQLKPDRRFFLKHLEAQAIIVLPLPSEVPAYREYPHRTRLEKILVDLFANKLMQELTDRDMCRQIFEQAFSSYIIEESALFRYARRRNKEAAIREFISQETTVELLGD